MATSFFFSFIPLFSRTHWLLQPPTLCEGVVASRVEAFLAPLILVHLPRAHSQTQPEKGKFYTKSAPTHTHAHSRLREREFYYPFFFCLRKERFRKIVAKFPNLFGRIPLRGRIFPVLLHHFRGCHHFLAGVFWLEHRFFHCFLILEKCWQSFLSSKIFTASLELSSKTTFSSSFRDFHRQGDEFSRTSGTIFP